MKNVKNMLNFGILNPTFRIENPNQIGGGVTVNKIRYVVEPLVDRGILRGINFYSTKDSE